VVAPRAPRSRPPGPLSPARPPVVLSIAGSDSGGGAGIQADLKAIACAGCHGTTAITAITAQNTLGVSAVHPLPPEAIIDQVRAVAGDIGVDAVKIGMVGGAEAIEAVAQALGLTSPAPVVLDPVMVAESGARLLPDDAVDALISRLLPNAAVTTPNLPEAHVLAGAAEDTPPGELARAIHDRGARAVVVTGGHGEEAIDVFFDGDRLESIRGVRHPDGAAHGSGCTHSSTLAAELAKGADPFGAAGSAKDSAARAVRDGLRGIGAGPGPVDVLGIGSR